MAIRHLRSKLGLPGHHPHAHRPFESGKRRQQHRPEQVTRLGEYYRNNGAPPSVVGDAVVQAVRKGRGLVLVGPHAALIYHLRRISRTLFNRVLIADFRRMGWI